MSSWTFRGRLTVSCSLLWGFWVVSKGTENGDSQLFQTIGDSGYVGWLETTRTHTGKFPHQSDLTVQLLFNTVHELQRLQSLTIFIYPTVCRSDSWLQLTVFQSIPYVFGVIPNLPWWCCHSFELKYLFSPLLPALSQLCFCPLTYSHMLIQLRAGTDTWYSRVSCVCLRCRCFPQARHCTNKKSF